MKSHRIKLIVLLALPFCLSSLPNNSYPQTKALDIFYLRPVISDSLKAKGLSTTKEAEVNSDNDTTYNLVRVYINFAREFHGVITLTARDSSGFKLGDCEMPVDASAGEALYYDFHFEHRVDMDLSSGLLLW